MNLLERYVKEKLYTTHLTDENNTAVYITEEQIKQVDAIIKKGMLYAAIAGALAVIACYVPYHYLVQTPSKLLRYGFQFMRIMLS